MRREPYKSVLLWSKQGDVDKVLQCYSFMAVHLYFKLAKPWEIKLGAVAKLLPFLRLWSLQISYLPFSVLSWHFLDTWSYVNIIHKPSTQTNGCGTTPTLSLLRNNIWTIPYHKANRWIQLIGKCTIIQQGNEFDYKKSIKFIKSQMQWEWWEPLNQSHVDQNSCLLLYEWNV